MRVDVHQLGTLRELAHEGAHRAAHALGHLADEEIHVRVTNIALVSRGDLIEELGASRFVGVGIQFRGGLEGTTAIAFEDEEGVSDVAELLSIDATATSPSFERSAVEEVGNIMTSGFIDGWANYLGSSIDISPPSFLQGSGEDILPSQPTNLEEPTQYLVFESRMEAVEGDVRFRIFMLPERDSMADLLKSYRREGDRSISLEKLSVFNEMTKQGAARAAENISTMTGIRTSVNVSRLRFVPIEQAPSHVGDDAYVGVVFRYDGLPSGYLAILFDDEAARRLIDTLVSSTSPERDWGELERSAMKEVGNIMTSGFIDGWANVLESTIDHSPPQFVDDIGSAIMSPIAGRLGETQDFAFIMDSTIEAAEQAIGCHIYALPSEAELTTALDELMVRRRDELEADPEKIFSGG